MTCQIVTSQLRMKVDVKVQAKILQFWSSHRLAFEIIWPI